MDDLGGLIVGVIVIGVVIAIVVEIVKFFYYLLLFIFSNIVVLFDNILGGWIFVPPYISWAIVGFAAGTLLYFAVKEAHKLSRPKIRPLLIGITCLFIISTFFVGLLGSNNIREERRKLSVKKEISTPGSVYSGNYLDYWEAGKELFYKEEYEKALQLFKIARQKKNSSELEQFIGETEKRIRTIQLNESFKKNSQEKNFDGMFFNLVEMKQLQGKDYNKFDLLEEISMTDSTGRKHVILGGIPFVYIKPGKFLMGCFNPGDRLLLSDAVPVHQVELSGFWISQTEITEKQFNRGNSQLPVCNVSWAEVVNFAKEFGKKYGIDANVPTEAQWEFAARNRGEETLYPWGNNIDKTKANYRDTGSRILPIGSFYPNKQGIFDISGNLREWCRDYYSDTFYSNNKAKMKDPLNSTVNQEVVIRGGCYADGNFALKTYVRYSRSKNSRDKFTGFRIVLEK